MQKRWRPLLEDLILHHANPNSKTTSGNTPLMMALHNSDNEGVSMLLHADANPNREGGESICFFFLHTDGIRLLSTTFCSTNPKF